MRLHNSNYFVFYGNIDDPQIWRERETEREREREQASKQWRSSVVHNLWKLFLQVFCCELEGGVLAVMGLFKSLEYRQVQQLRKY
jgi:hypothetical protein